MIVFFNVWNSETIEVGWSVSAGCWQLTFYFASCFSISQPDSLGPLDLDIPSSRYHTEDLILSDSLSGLNRLLASSLDAFQNCSFFGLDKKEMASAVEAQKTASFSDFKIGSEV